MFAEQHFHFELAASFGSPLQSPLSVFFSVFSALALHSLSFLAASRFDIAADLTHRVVATSQDRSCERSLDKGGGSLFNAYFKVETNSRRFRYGRQFGNCTKNALDGWDGTIAHLPMAMASAVVVHSTSVRLGLIKMEYASPANEE